MLTITIRTDKPDAEIGLFDGEQQLAYETWHAHRTLAETIHTKLQEMLSAQAKTWNDIEGLVVFKGPGSFTGLRIGITVANTLAYALQVPIVGAMGDDWVTQGNAALRGGHNDGQVMPEYGGDAHITPQKK
jgi:tRNA threonylcarbamoyladenosine biosynthesis protein TsaB